MIQRKFLRYSLIIVVVIFGAIFTWTSVKYTVNKKQHKTDTVIAGEEFLLRCASYNFEITGNKLTSAGNDPLLFFEHKISVPYRSIVVTLSELSTDIVIQVFWAREGEELSVFKSSSTKATTGTNHINIPSEGIFLLHFYLAGNASVTMVVESVEFINVEALKRPSPFILCFYATIFSAFCCFIMALIFVLKKPDNIEKAFAGVILKSDGVTSVTCQIRRFIGMIFPILFLLLIFGIYIYKPFYLLFYSPEYTAPGIVTDKSKWFLENFIITVLSVCLMLFLVHIINRGKIAANISDKKEKIIVNGIILLFFILIFINKLSLFSDIVTYDNNFVRSGAYSIMTIGAIPEGVQGQLLYSTNNRGIILWLGLLGRISNDLLIPYRLLWIFIDSVFITLAVLFVYLTIKLFCKSQISLIVLVLSAIFLVFSACVTPLANTGGDWYTCYTDSSSMPFTTISIYCFTRFFAKNGNGRRNAILVLLGSISSAVGYLFKPTALISIIAYVSILLLCSRVNAIKIRNLLKNVAFIVLGLCFIIYPFEKVYDHFETIDGTPAANLMAHYLVTGMLNTNQNINKNGVMVFDEPQLSLDPFKDRGRWNYAEAGFPVKQVLRERIKTMNIALLGFYYLKDVNNLSFTYGFHSSAYSMGNSPVSYYRTPFLEKWKAGLLKIQTPIRATIWNVMFWLIGIWAFYLLKNKISLSPTESFLSLTMLGVFAYLTLFESGDRYVMQFWPVFLIVSSLGLMCLWKHLRTL